MPRTPLREAIAELAITIESGELPRVVSADDEATLDAIRFVFQQWYPLTDNAGLELSASAEEIGQAYFARGADPYNWAWAPSSA
ncbi:hypothetical protein Mlaev_02430 [Microbacterium laevaniformans]|uniref:Uncharacterized protein n=1 Tax=Microbacterium laevaniformans TaxID=36807 RepID=A0A150H9D3_9MICO|nr:hypothetical protein [Microbacterium laevaniformans]KXZ58727.1 hypothetical protein Mlaev_02430 [Microbacterium laevaniformans]